MSALTRKPSISKVGGMGPPYPSGTRPESPGWRHRMARGAVSAYVPPMDPTHLDTTLAPLTHADRMKRMVALGRAAREGAPLQIS